MEKQVPLHLTIDCSRKSQYLPLNLTDMETKKSKRADLETAKNLFFQAGLIVALSLSLAAFEWKSPLSRQLDAALDPWDKVIDDQAPISIPEPVAPKPVPPSFTAINLVENTEKVPDYDPFTAETNQSEEIPLYVPAYHPTLPDEPAVPEPEPFIIAEKMPEFPGGEEAMRDFLSRNIQYPETAKNAGIEGTVYLNFIVEKDGSISAIKLLRPIGGDLDDEAIRVIRLMPKWNPGMQHFKPVRVSFNMPIVFKLR